MPRGQGAWEHGDLGAWGLGAWEPNSLGLGGKVTFLIVQLGTSHYLWFRPQHHMNQMWECSPRKMEAARSRVEGQAWLFTELEDSLNYRLHESPSLKTKQR